MPTPRSHRFSFFLLCFFNQFNVNNVLRVFESKVRAKMALPMTHGPLTHSTAHQIQLSIDLFSFQHTSDSDKTRTAQKISQRHVTDLSVEVWVHGPPNRNIKCINRFDGKINKINVWTWTLRCYVCRLEWLMNSWVSQIGKLVESLKNRPLKLI